MGAAVDRSSSIRPSLFPQCADCIVAKARLRRAFNETAGMGLPRIRCMLNDGESGDRQTVTMFVLAKDQSNVAAVMVNNVLLLNFPGATALYSAPFGSVGSVDVTDECPGLKASR